MYQQTFQLQATTAHPPQQAPGFYEKLTVTPVSGALGADVTDVDLRSLDNITFGEVERALTDHLVLFVRDQCTLGVEEQNVEALGRFVCKLGVAIGYYLVPSAQHRFIHYLQASHSDADLPCDFDGGDGCFADAVHPE